MSRKDQSGDLVGVVVQVVVGNEAAERPGHQDVRRLTVHASKDALHVVAHRRPGVCTRVHGFAAADVPPVVKTHTVVVGQQRG